MLTTVAPNGAGLRVLAGTKSRPPRWSGALASFFDVSRNVLDSVLADVRSGRLAQPTFLFGGTGDHDLADTLDTLMTAIDSEYDLPLYSPFEDTESIAGALWSGHELFGLGREDALAKLRFSAGTLDLPLHVHEHSDRFIVVLSGKGRFWWSEESWRKFTGIGIQSTPVHVGDVLVFTRDLLHTFSAPDEDLLLLSYHSPEISFNDPRQFTLPFLRWTPRSAVAH
ncbi:MAG: cupin domain-containing protein [Nitrospira sp. CR1.3]|nr:cupin domain-containing protein [Nitrospira sp. CR1.3]